MVLRARVVVGCRAVFEEGLAGVVRVVVGVTGSLVLASRVRGARLAATRLVPPLVSGRGGARASALVCLGPACAHLRSWDDGRPGCLTVGRLGRFSSSSFQVVGEVLLGQLSAPDVYM